MVNIIAIISTMVWFPGAGMVCFALFSVDARFRHVDARFRLMAIGLLLIGIGLLLPVIGWRIM